MTVLKSGICRVCGCTDHNPCYNPNVGTCWWVDESHTLCSHCAEEVLSCDPETIHCINDLDFPEDTDIEQLTHEDLW